MKSKADIIKIYEAKGHVRIPQNERHYSRASTSRVLIPTKRSTLQREQFPPPNIDLPKNLYFDSKTKTLEVIMKSDMIKIIIFRDDFRQFNREQLTELADLHFYDYQQKNMFVGSQRNDHSKYLKD